MINEEENYRTALPLTIPQSGGFGRFEMVFTSFNAVPGRFEMSSTSFNVNPGPFETDSGYFNAVPGRFEMSSGYFNASPGFVYNRVRG